MKLKLIIVVLYALVLLVVAWLPVRSFASPETTKQKSQISIPLDTQRRRGLVLFNHKTHEALLNPDTTFKHKGRPNVACITCHHTVTEVTSFKQFQNCSDCHKNEANPGNPDDVEGIDLNAREIYHRLCISCHRATEFRASNYRIKDSKFTKCGECHEKDSNIVVTADLRDEQPPVLDPNEEIYPLRAIIKNYPAPREIVKTPVDPPIGYAGESRI